jgi:hypothetical protein
MRKKDQERFAKLLEHGCVCCKQLGFYNVPEIHHILSGGRRMGHEYTIPLSPWHHRGVSADAAVSRRLFGPSLAHGSKPFTKFWGSELELLRRVNEAIGFEAGKSANDSQNSG